MNATRDPSIDPEDESAREGVAIVGIACRLPEAEGPGPFWRKLFGFGPREADQTDPQQRLFLECCWRALVHGGYDRQREPDIVSVYGRLYGDLDPNTCSLVAVHLACQALLECQADLALAGGACVVFPQTAGHRYRAGGIFSPDGHCRAFDAEATGTVGGDGVGVVLLKRLEDALADGDTIYAVIRGSAINNDGATKVGLTAPSVEALASFDLRAAPRRGAHHRLEGRPSPKPGAPHCSPISTLMADPPAERDWIYQPSWTRSVLCPRDAQPPAMTVVAFMFDANVSLIDHLERAWGRVLVVVPGRSFVRLSRDVYALPPDDDDALDRLLDQLDAAAPFRVLHAWLLGANDSWRRTWRAGFATLQSLLRVTKRRALELSAIDVLTHGAADLCGDEALSPAKAMILGLCRAIPLEHPEISCRCIDLTHAEVDSLHLIAEFERPRSEIVAYRGRHRWVEAWAPLTELPAQAALREGGVYLITGGLGNLGLALAEHLAGSVGARLILTGRGGLPPRDEWDAAAQLEDPRRREIIARLRALEADDIEFDIYAVDVADRRAMAALFDAILDRHGRLDGVFHCAGNVGKGLFAPIVELGPEQVESQLRPKLEGVEVLAELMPPGVEHCVVFSSLATVLGGLGSAAYAAANTYMDVFCQSQARRRTSTRWLAVDWDFHHPRLTRGADVDPWMSGARATAPALEPERSAELISRLLAVPGLSRVAVAGASLDTRRPAPATLSEVQRQVLSQLPFPAQTAAPPTKRCPGLNVVKVEDGLT